MYPVLCDLDGVVWLAHRAIPGSAAAVASLRAAGHRVLFVTNNSSARIAEHEAALSAVGIDAHGDVVSSAGAAALLVEPGERVLVAAAAGVTEALERRGAIVVSGARAAAGDPPLGSVDGAFDAVVVGWHRSFDFESLTRASSAVRAGARLIATNDDPTYPTPDGPIPGGGSIVAAVEPASGRRAEIAGKPFEPMAVLVREMVGDDWSDRAVMVGDRPSTDGRFARTLGCRYAHVWSGITPHGAPVDPSPDLVGDDLAVIAALISADR